MARKKEKNGKPVSFYMDADIYEKVREYASREGRTKTKTIEMILKEFFDRKENKE